MGNKQNAQFYVPGAICIEYVERIILQGKFSEVTSERIDNFLQHVTTAVKQNKNKFKK